MSLQVYGAVRSLGIPDETEHSKKKREEINFIKSISIFVDSKQKINLVAPFSVLMAEALSLDLRSTNILLESFPLSYRRLVADIYKILKLDLDKKKVINLHCQLKNALLLLNKQRYPVQRLAESTPNSAALNIHSLYCTKQYHWLNYLANPENITNRAKIDYMLSLSAFGVISKGMAALIHSFWKFIKFSGSRVEIISEIEKNEYFLMQDLVQLISLQSDFKNVKATISTFLNCRFQETNNFYSKYSNKVLTDYVNFRRRLFVPACLIEIQKTLYPTKMDAEVFIYPCAIFKIPEEIQLSKLPLQLKSKKLELGILHSKMYRRQAPDLSVEQLKAYRLKLIDEILKIEVEMRGLVAVVKEIITVEPSLRLNHAKKVKKIYELFYSSPIFGTLDTIQPFEEINIEGRGPSFYDKLVARDQKILKLLKS